MIRFVLAALIAFAAASPALAAGGCATPGDGATLSAEIGRLLNAARAGKGLAPLRPSAALAAAASGHACDMVRRDYFAHESRSGGSVMDRARRQGYRACLIAENIAMGYPGVAQTHRGWMGSPGHRRNILMEGVAEFGLGVAAPGPGQGGGLRWVLVLARPC